MTLAEAAAVLGLAPATLRTQARKGRLQAVRHGREWWVEPAEVERYARVVRGRPGRRPKGRE